MKTITGKFEVTMKPLDNYSTNEIGSKLGRMSLDKMFHGALTAKSEGEMLSAMSPVDGSAGYVAIEKVDGNLEGKVGTFVLQHFGIMSGDKSRLILEVVPASGTGELTGLTGTMEIRNEEGVHYYDFAYEV